MKGYLRRCVDSILSQTFTDFELILIDDGSPDRCGEICDEYQQRDKRVVVIHQSNGGLSAARNAGIEWCFENSNSSWFTFIDSDDWVHPEYLNDLLNAALEFQTKIIICRFCEATDENVRINESGNNEITTPKIFMTKIVLMQQWHGGSFMTESALKKFAILRENYMRMSSRHTKYCFSIRMLQL